MAHTSADIIKPHLDSATQHYAVTPSDTDTYSGWRAVYIGGAGNLVVEMRGVTATYAVVAGQIVPVSPNKVTAATTATGVVLLG